MNNFDRIEHKEYNTLGISFYTGPSPRDIIGYYNYWRMQLYFLVGEETVKRIIEDGINEDEIMDEIGISKEEFIKPHRYVIEKARKYANK